jgi:2-amino-4-hydroxy-6-hydroxymethyldihydropteridine diphosphokinase
MKPTNRVFLSIGGNLGDREANLEEALMFIGFNMGDIVLSSEVIETEAWGMPAETPPFLNQVVEISTQLTWQELMNEIAELEDYYGRVRKDTGYQNREMDVDVLSFNDEIIEEEQLQVPHPKMHLRDFVLVPLAATWPEWMHPVLKKTSVQLLADLRK